MVLAVTQRSMLWHQQAPDRTVPFAMEEASDDFARRLGLQLMYLRGVAGIPSQAKMAELMSVSESKVQRWESGDGLPDAWEISRLCKLLGCEPEELIRPEQLSPREQELIRRVAKGRRRAGPKRRGGGGRA